MKALLLYIIAIFVVLVVRYRKYHFTVRALSVSGSLGAHWINSSKNKDCSYQQLLLLGTIPHTLAYWPEIEWNLIGNFSIGEQVDQFSLCRMGLFLFWFCRILVGFQEMPHQFMGVHAT